ncbi:MAG: Hsp20/alpha crystallin family protein [Patescibacteria group bacterium]
MNKLRVTTPFSRLFANQFPFDFEDVWPEVTAERGLDVYEEDDKVIVKAAVPGVPADNVNITYEDGVLRIRARFEESEEDKKKKKAVYRMERITTFDYATTFPRPVDTNAISAKVTDGVVVITAPIAEAAKPKTIAVTASE